MSETKLKPDMTVFAVLARVITLVILFIVNEWLWDALFFDWLALDNESRVVLAIHFFIYDLIKIMLLVIGITYLLTLLQSAINTEDVKRWLAGKGEGYGHLMAAGLGVVTPFCSCSSIPLFLGFTRAGIPLGVTMTFLVASPLVSEIAFVLLVVYFGWQLAVLYLVAGFVISIATGWIIQRLKLEKWLEPLATKSLVITEAGSRIGRPKFAQRALIAQDEAVSIAKSVFIYVAIGIAVGALIYGWVPAQLIQDIAGGDNPFAVPLLVVLGIPLYGGGAAVLPLIEVMGAAGVPIGTLLALMMSVIALSLPEFIMLRKAMKPQLIATFLVIVALSIIAIGYLFNGVFG